MEKKIKIIIASCNKGKITEFNNILGKFPIKLLSLLDFNKIPNIKEDGLSFQENAYKKANIVSKFFNLPAISDDSGLIIKKLNGAPGIYSSRYGKSDKKRCNRILKELGSSSNRDAYFQCAICIVVPSGKVLTYQGKCTGKITNEKIGFNGFGYDPIFFCDKLKKTFGEASIEEKNIISHRGIALKKITTEFKTILSWIKLNLNYKNK